jgi:DNA-directed RNA polymerase specialized sigma24 family protein
MFTILFHVVHHYRRKWFRFTGPGEDGLRDAPVPRPVVTQLTDQEILRALDAIPAKFREVVLLCDVEEFSYKEIHEILEIPIGTVMSRLSRGRQMLRENLAHLRHGNGFSLGKHAVA